MGFPARVGSRRGFPARVGSRRGFPARVGSRMGFPARVGSRRGFPARVGSRRGFPARVGSRRGFPRQERVCSLLLTTNFTDVRTCASNQPPVSAFDALHCPALALCHRSGQKKNVAQKQQCTDAAKALDDLCKLGIDYKKRQIADNIAVVDRTQFVIKTITKHAKQGLYNLADDKVHHAHDIERKADAPSTVSECLAAVFDKYGKGPMFERIKYTAHERARLAKAWNEYVQHKPSRPASVKKK
jgi:hypothetical protein